MAGKPNIDDEQLNRIYNTCDVGINTSTGEGWGLVALEHAATGRPQLLPAHSACLEIWEKHGFLIPTKDSPGDELDIAPAVSQFNLYYSQPQLRWEAGERAMKYARGPRFSWDEIGARWDDLFLRGSFQHASGTP
jgi:D-inositol-3-phosphate glycosyltransferase